MKKLITVSNVTEVAELLKNIELSHIQKDQQPDAKVLIDAFKIAHNEFKQPLPNRISPIEQFDIQLRNLITTTQGVFNNLEPTIQQKILKKIKYKDIEAIL